MLDGIKKGEEMKIIYLIIIIILLTGCATQQKLRYQNWYITFLEKEFATIKTDIELLSNELKDGNITREEFDYLIEKKFNFIKIRINWMKEEYEKQISGEIKEQDFNIEIQLIDKE